MIFNSMLKSSNYVMTIIFKVIKLIKHHNRGQFIFARQIGFKEPLLIKDGSLLNGIPVYHALDMYPFSKDDDPQFDVYVFRPMGMDGYPDGFFKEEQIVELVLQP